MSEKYACSDCNHILDEVKDAEQCSNCGAEWQDGFGDEPEGSLPRKIVAGLIAFFTTLLSVTTLFTIIASIGRLTDFGNNFNGGKLLGNVCGGVLFIVSLYFARLIYLKIVGWKRNTLLTIFFIYCVFYFILFSVPSWL